MPLIVGHADVKDDGACGYVVVHAPPGALSFNWDTLFHFIQVKLSFLKYLNTNASNRKVLLYYHKSNTNN